MAIEVKSMSELLNSLKSSVNNENAGKLENTVDIWKRIANGSEFPELEGTGMTISEWIKNNPYSAIQ